MTQKRNENIGLFAFYRKRAAIVLTTFGTRDHATRTRRHSPVAAWVIVITPSGVRITIAPTGPGLECVGQDKAAIFATGCRTIAKYRDCTCLRREACTGGIIAFI
jgi:hypothetical protein